ncbi:MAG: gamma-glutamyltransferase [Rubrivivax sp.]|nr:gamma-glutamyltransferase [Rubrivivax sp.]
MDRSGQWRSAWLLAWLSSVALLLTACGGSDDPDPVDTACQTTTADGSVVVGSGEPGDPAAPEPSSGYRLGKTVTKARSYMVVTANPRASKAGCEVLKAGGNAVDAAVAVQMVLGLVEPQSSGLGGGAFMLHYDAATKTVLSYDGRETAPADASEDYLRWISDAERSTPQPSARASGRSIGTPGTVRMLALAHSEHGKMPWKDLFQPGIDLATQGFPISGRMAAAISGARTNFLRDADAVAAYLDADGNPKALGSTFTLPAYADTLKAIADGGAQAFYTGAIAQDIVDEVRASTGANGVAMTPGTMTLADLAGYQAKKRPAVCRSYRAYLVCGMGPPSSGGITVASTLGILENFDLARHKPTALDIYGGKPTVMGVHLVAEANRLAYADRNKYIADTDFVPLPGGNWDLMLSQDYLRGRADLISFGSSLGTAAPGNLGPVPLGVGMQPAESGTTHMTIVDRQGNVVSMTTTVESGFGAWRMVRGFILNNELTDFSAAPLDADGLPVANRVQAGKRPRSSMAPTLVFKQADDGSIGELVMATGSPGGANIIQYVVKTVVGVIDWGLDAQQATSLVNFGSSNGPTTNLGGEHPNINTANGGNDDPLIVGLRALGHTVTGAAQSSGTSTIVRITRDGDGPAWAGGADPRREGLVLGDGY